MYGRRSKRHKDARGQQHLDFGPDETAELAADAAGLTPDEEIVVQYIKRRKPRAEQSHPNISALSLIVLRGTSGNLRALRNEALRPG